MEEDEASSEHASVAMSARERGRGVAREWVPCLPPDDEDGEDDGGCVFKRHPCSTAAGAGLVSFVILWAFWSADVPISAGVAQANALAQGRPPGRPNIGVGKPGGGNASAPPVRAPPPVLCTDAALCNLTAPVPAGPARALRKWPLPPGWPERCLAVEEKIGEDYPTYGIEIRDWCWVNLKGLCHHHVREQWSWAMVQDLAAATGVVPPRRRAPDASPVNAMGDPEVCEKREFGAKVLKRRGEQYRKGPVVKVLTLPTALGRYNLLAARLKILGINATRMLGLDTRVPGAVEQAKAHGWIPPDFDWVQAELRSIALIAGSVGCASGHFMIQDQILADGAPLALVFEDDVFVENDFVLRLWQLVTKELPPDWELLSLSSRCSFGKCISKHLYRVQVDLSEPYELCHSGVNWGTQGLLYRAAAIPHLQAIWKASNFNVTRSTCIDVDVSAAAIADQVGYYAVPEFQYPGLLREGLFASSRLMINAGVIFGPRMAALVAALCFFVAWYQAGCRCRKTVNICLHALAPGPQSTCLSVLTAVRAAFLGAIRSGRCRA